MTNITQKDIFELIQKGHSMSESIHRFDVKEEIFDLFYDFCKEKGAKEDYLSSLHYWKDQILSTKEGDEWLNKETKYPPEKIGGK